MSFTSGGSIKIDDILGSTGNSNPGRRPERENYLLQQVGGKIPGSSGRGDRGQAREGIFSHHRDPRSAAGR